MLSSFSNRKPFSETNKLQQSSNHHQFYLTDCTAQISKLGLKHTHDLTPDQIGTEDDTITPRSPTGADATYSNKLKFKEVKEKDDNNHTIIYGIFKASLGDTFSSDIRTIEIDPANNTDKKKTYAIIALMNAKTAATLDAINLTLSNEINNLPVATKHKAALDTLILFNYFHELYYANNKNNYPFATLKASYLRTLSSDPGSETSLQREAILGTSYTDWNTFYNHFSNYLTTRTVLATNSHPTKVTTVPTAPVAIPNPIATLGNVNNSTMQPINGYPAPQFVNQYNQHPYGMPQAPQRWNTSNQQGGGNSGGRYSPSSRYNSQNRSTRNNNRGYHPYEPLSQMPPNANQSNQSRNQQHGRNGQNMNPSRNNGRQQQQQQYHQNNRNGQHPQQQQQGNRNQNYGNNNNSQDPRNNTLASQFQINNANNNDNQQQSSSNNNEQLVQQIMQHSVNRTQFRELDYDQWYDDDYMPHLVDDDNNIVILPVNNTYSDVEDED
jgi:hypothetical protein